MDRDLNIVPELLDILQFLEQSFIYLEIIRTNVGISHE